MLFVKEPKLGDVKTRLAVHCGDAFTLELYQCFVHDLLYTLQGGSHDFKICGTPTLASINETFGNFDNFLQTDGDLGKKMKTAFEAQFAKGYEKIILIGSDTPHVSQILITESFNTLEYSDVVLGPSRDGGYYLIGFNKTSFCKDAFEEIEWSTPKVLTQTLQRVQTKRVELLQELNDIDILDDLKDFYENYHEGYFEHSYTIAFLKENITWNTLTS